MTSTFAAKLLDALFDRVAAGAQDRSQRWAAIGKHHGGCAGLNEQDARGGAVAFDLICQVFDRADDVLWLGGHRHWLEIGFLGL